MDSKPISSNAGLPMDDSPGHSQQKMRMGCMHCHKVIDADASFCSGCQSTDPFGIKRRKDKWKLNLLLAGVMVVMGLWCIFRLGFID